MDDARRKAARIRLMEALSLALHRAVDDGLDPYDDIDEVLGLARHGLTDLDDALRREQGSESPP